MFLVPEEQFLQLHAVSNKATYATVEERIDRKWYILQVAAEKGKEVRYFGLKTYRKKERSFPTIDSALSYIKKKMPHYTQVAVHFLPL